MFTWICPQCGREVPPAYSECPDCAARSAAGSAPPSGAAAPLQEPQAVPPAPVSAAAGEARPAVRPQPFSPMFQTPGPQAPQDPPRRGGMQVPTWLMALLFALGFVAVGGGVFWFIGSQRAQKLSATGESPAAKPGATQNPVQKYIEVTGLRFSPMTKGVQVTFVLVNHSDSDLVGLAGNVTIWGRTQKSEEDAVGTFTFQTSMAAQASKELTMPLTTKLKLVEMPDWQNVTVDVQITAPPGA